MRKLTTEVLSLLFACYKTISVSADGENIV